MEVGGNLSRPLHRDGLGQSGIDTSDPGSQRARCLGIEVDDLRQRMNAGVGASGTDGRHPMAGKCRQGNFHQILDRIAGGLGLPTGKSGTIVGQTERHPHGRRRTTIRLPNARPRRRSAPRSGNLAQHGTRLLLLPAITTLDDFLQQFASTFFVADFLIG